MEKREYPPAVLVHSESCPDVATLRMRGAPLIPMVTPAIARAHPNGRMHSCYHFTLQTRGVVETVRYPPVRAIDSGVRRRHNAVMRGVYGNAWRSRPPRPAAGRPLTSAQRCAAIQAATWVRLVRPSLVRMCSTWLSAVRCEMTSLAAISLLARPWAIRSATCCSRRVRAAGGSSRGDVAGRCGSSSRAKATASSRDSRSPCAKAAW